MSRIIILALLSILEFFNCTTRLESIRKGFIFSSKVTASDFPKKNPPYEKSYAVSIGINDYPKIKPSNNLRNACNDALAFKEYLEKYENFNEVQCILNENATVPNIKQAIRQILEKSKSNDRLIIFFSGHGQTVGGDGYLIAYDSSFDDAFSSGYRIGELVDQIKSLNSAKHVLIIIDACYAGLGYQTKGFTSISFNVLQMYTKKRYLGILSAASSDETAIEDNESPYSLFSRFLIQGLMRGTADLTNDSIITVTELFEYTRFQVQRTAIDRFGKMQTPQYRHIFGEGEFVFMGTNFDFSKTDISTHKKYATSKGECKLALLDIYSSPITMTKEFSKWLRELIERELNNNFKFIDLKSARDSLKLDKPEGEYVLYPDLIIRDFGWSLKTDKIATAVIAKINHQIQISFNIIDVIAGTKQNYTLICRENRIEIELNKKIEEIRNNLK